VRSITTLVIVLWGRENYAVCSCYRYCKMRQATSGKDAGRPKSQQPKDRRLTLTTEDLAAALKEVRLPSAWLTYSTL